MKSMKKINLYMFISFIAIAMILLACKKDESKETPTPTAPTEVKNYSGSTSDYGMPVTFSTGKVNGETWLLGYTMAVKFALGGVTLYEDNFAYSVSSGIVKLIDNEFQFNNGDGLILTAGLNEVTKTIGGQYNWNYYQDLIHSGNFAALMQ
jgi:hypothetical protein